MGKEGCGREEDEGGGEGGREGGQEEMAERDTG